MIGTILRIGWLELRRDRIALALTFALPIVFFSIFAVIFGGQKNQATNKVKLLLVDEDQSDVSRRLLMAIKNEPGFNARTAIDAQAANQAIDKPLTRVDAEAAVRDGKFSVAIVLPKGIGKSFPNFDGGGLAIELLADTSDPIAPQVVGGLLQKVAMTGVPDLMLDVGLGQFEKFAGTLTDEQRKAVDQWMPMLKDGTANWFSQPDTKNTPPGQDGATAMGGLVSIKVTDVLGQQKSNPVISFYAAGTGVMFLLFMCAGAGGSLLEEVENGTLDRLLSSNVGMTGLLAGKWVFLTLVGISQMIVMFVWGAVVFRLDLWSHLPGFAVMTLATTAAASAFGLLLATTCRSRGQLSGISTIVILVMSAVGGSMFPRFLMSESLQRFGLVTFNAWALDGYVKVFWRDLSVYDLWREVSVLIACAALFLIAARLLARRWECV